MSKLKKYDVRSSVTISLNATVYARSKKHAAELAEELSMPDLHENTRYDEPGESHDEWRTSGELDGSAVEIEADLSDEQDNDE